MSLRAVDLNLLVVFDALMSERNVTRAASRIAMSQPAVSNALARLRHTFKDQLLVRTANGMEPTPRALELAAGVRSIVHQSERLLASDVSFSPGASERVFTVRMSDLVGLLILPGVIERLRREAPGVGLNIVHLPPEQTIKWLESDQLELAVSMQLRHASTIRSEPLLPDRMVCVARRDHPLFAGKPSLARFLDYQHVRVSISPLDLRFVDGVLADRGLRRRVVLNLPHWLLVPYVLLSSDLLAVMSERIARQFADHGVRYAELPFKSEPFFWTLYWHRRYDSSRAHTWIRELIRATCVAEPARAPLRRSRSRRPRS
jgi:DNA-binding transcriptional LysR family regulator